MATAIAKMNPTQRWLSLAVVIGILTRFIDLGYQSYSMDELWELSIVRLPAGEIVTVGDGFPPLFHLIFRGLIVAGFGDFIGRVLSAVLGVATVWLAGRLGRHIGPRVGVTAALAVAIAPLLVLLSKEARAYGVFILIAGLLMLATWRVIDAPTTRSWIGFAAALSLGMYTHYMFALAIASAELVLLWSLRGDRSQLHRWVVTHAVVAVTLIPLVVIAIPDFALDAANGYSRTVDVAAVGYAGFSLFTGFTLGPSTRALHTMDTAAAINAALPWIALIGVPAIYLFARGWRSLGSDWRLRLGIPIALPLALLTLFSATIGVAFRVRYLAWTIIPLAIWLSAGYLRGSGKLRHLAAGTLVLLSLAAMVTRVTVDDHQVEDARAAAEFIAQYPETPAITMAWYMTKPIEYYLGAESATLLPADEGKHRFLYHEQLNNRLVPIPSLSETDRNMTEQADVFAAVVGVGEEYLFVRSREFHADPDNRYLEQRRVEDGLQPIAEFAGITVYRGVRGG